MYQHLFVSLAIAAAPFVAAVPQTPSTQKPATPSTQKPTTPSTQKPASKGVRTVEIVGTDDMKFSLSTITAKPGEQLRVRLVSKGTMPKVAMAHNFVLLQKGASQVKFVTAGATARATDFIPPDMKAQVIAATSLAGPGETVEVTFKVPAAPGEYPFLCTFPGHFQAGMRGTLTVK
ncbi:MAG: plastocyanin/azurin family copper-binding protein [Vicinamibacterales bacterium]